jgi:hypothetical protein
VANTRMMQNVMSKYIHSVTLFDWIGMYDTNKICNNVQMKSKMVRYRKTNPV